MYQSPLDEFHFLLTKVLPFDRVTETDRFAETTPDVAMAILTEAGRLCDTALAPLQRVGDTHPARIENGVVTSPPGFRDAFRAIAEGGWIGISAGEDYGGPGLPQTLTTAVNDMMSGACLTIQLNPLMGQGLIETLEHHASDSLKAMYLPRLISGEWTGTMNLTEPQAGSDVGALTTKAVPNGDGTYAVTGQKIYITWGEHDLTENICHLVLARLPDAPAGTKGISLFMVPKVLPNPDGSLGARNSLHAVSLEHKLGLHGSPTAVMQYDGATGFMIGAPNDGMRAMFTMMNNARLGVGVQGIGVAEAAMQKALAYAQDRHQGRTPLGDGRGPIADHADVRRMLMTMQAETFAARAIALQNAIAIDMATATAARNWQDRAALLTPITKAFGTDIGIEVAQMGIQVHGGMGFVEETGAAQYLRDVRVTAIYEGTNGIQAMDLVGRKMMDGGDTAYRLLEEIETGAEAARGLLPDLAESVWGAAESLREATEALVKQPDLNARFAVSVPYLRAFARVLGADLHLAAARAVGGQGPRAQLAAFYIRRLLPEHVGLLAHVAEGDRDLYDPRERQGSAA